EVGADQLAGRALADRQALARRGIEQLDEHTIAGMIVEIARMLALASEDRHDLREAEVGVANLESPGRLQPVAEGLVVEPGLAAEESQLESQRPGLPAHLIAQHLLEECRVRRRAVDAGDPELVDRLEQLARIADAEWHRSGPARFDDQVVGDATGPQ